MHNEVWGYTEIFPTTVNTMSLFKPLQSMQKWKFTRGKHKLTFCTALHRSILYSFLSLLSSHPVVDQRLKYNYQHACICIERQPGRQQQAAHPRRIYSSSTPFCPLGGRLWWLLTWRVMAGLRCRANQTTRSIGILVPRRLSLYFQENRARDLVTSASRSSTIYIFRILQKALFRAWNLNFFLGDFPNPLKQELRPHPPIPTSNFCTL